MKITLFTLPAIALIIGMAFLVPPFLWPAPVDDVLRGSEYPKEWSAGDAVIRDDGPANTYQRYTVDFGEISGSGADSRTYVVRDLPRATFTIGVLVERSVGDEPLYDSKPVQATVTLVVRNSRGALVVSEEAPLDEWVWSGTSTEPNRSFVYRRGKEEVTPVGDGVFRAKQIEKKADDGWGSYFAPRRNEQYEVTLTTEELSPGDDNLSYRLVAHSVSW
jgi:hypothetical protein